MWRILKNSWVKKRFDFLRNVVLVNFNDYWRTWSIQTCQPNRISQSRLTQTRRALWVNEIVWLTKLNVAHIQSPPGTDLPYSWNALDSGRLSLSTSDINWKLSLVLADKANFEPLLLNSRNKSVFCHLLRRHSCWFIKFSGSRANTTMPVPITERRRLRIAQPWCEVICCGRKCMCVLLHMETEVCPWARFSHAVWSCLERWRSRRTSPLVNRTGECILWNLSGVMTCFSQPMTQRGEEIAGELRNSLYAIGPEGANGRPDIPKKAGSPEGVSQQMWAIAMSIVGWVNNKNTKCSYAWRWEQCEGKGKARRVMRAGGGRIGGFLHPHPSFFIY